VPHEPASPDPGRDQNPARDPGGPGDCPPPGPGAADLAGDVPEGWRELPPTHRDWLTEDEWEAQLFSGQDEEWIGPGDDPQDDPGDDRQHASRDDRQHAPGDDPQHAPGGTAKPARSARARRGFSRGPGQPGSARRPPAESCGPAGAFAAGRPLDTAPGGPALYGLAEYAAGAGDRFARATDDELTGILCALDRCEAAASALKHAAVAELIRRRPRDGCEPEDPGQMPAVWDEFAEQELADALAETRWAAGTMLDLAHTLAVKLPGTWAAFRAGTLRQSKVKIIADAVAALTPAEARAAEALVLDRAARLTPSGLRHAIWQAIKQVIPDKARKRREQARQEARVERWGEESGNAGLAGRELPPADVLAADQRISWWARQLKKAGLDGDMNQLRAQALVDILLGRDSRGIGADPQSPDTPPTASLIPAGFTGWVNLTVPLATQLGLAERPGELAGLGPIDAALARDLTAAAATSPQTTWCVTVTDEQGHAIGHGCARPEPIHHTRPPGTSKPGPPHTHDPPPGHDPPPAGFSFTPSDEPGPPGGYGSWRLITGVPGQRALLVSLDPIALDSCDHRFQARGHDPGVKLRHLAQIRHARCTAPTCRRPAHQCDFEHNVPYEAGGLTCLCNTGPKCRRDHRRKQHPRWKVEQLTPGTFRWTAPSGRQYTTEPTRYPI
jgi:hypothetical protein